METTYNVHSLKINECEKIFSPYGTKVCINFKNSVLGIRTASKKGFPPSGVSLSNSLIEIPNKIKIESVGHNIFVDNLDSQQGGELISFFIIFDDTIQCVIITATHQTSDDRIIIHDFTIKPGLV